MCKPLCYLSVPHLFLINSEASECWWSCQVFGVFFETLFVSRTTDVGSDILKPVVAILKRISTFRSGGVQAKSLRTLFGICVNQKCVVAESLLSSAMDFLVGLSPNLPPLVGTDVAYCIELSTVKALNSQGRLNIDWNIQSLIQICLSLCSCPTSKILPAKRREKGRSKLTDNLDFQTDGCCNSDARRCEHSLHSLANLLELMSNKQIQRAPDDVFVTILQTFSACLHVTTVSGAEKVRWNAALATSKVLSSQCFVCITHPYQSSEDNALLSLVSALCKALRMDSTDFSTRSSEEGGVVSGLNRNESQHRTACLFLCSLLLLHTAVYSLIALTVDNSQNAIKCLHRLASALAESSNADALKDHLKNVFSQAIAASNAGPLIFGRAKPLTSSCSAEAMPGDDGGEAGNVLAVGVSFAGRNSALKNFDFQYALPSALKAVKSFGHLAASVDLPKQDAAELCALAEALSIQSAAFLKDDAHAVEVLSLAELTNAFSIRTFAKGRFSTIDTKLLLIASMTGVRDLRDFPDQLLKDELCLSLRDDHLKQIICPWGAETDATPVRFCSWPINLVSSLRYLSWRTILFMVGTPGGLYHCCPTPERWYHSFRENL
ncbi:unnamed protein product [Dibothriocephalus latus]|uniref:Uncharacterized protein n=1 Tax=Dibothriocephalus latus TaxID=60516 RepID=A0A3P7NLY7_DIBLA|nr:unnamed protein product [Dibothriocephalus latus]